MTMLRLSFKSRLGMAVGAFLWVPLSALLKLRCLVGDWTLRCIMADLEEDSE